MIRFENYSLDARRVLSLSRESAERFNHDYIGTEHILFGLIEFADREYYFNIDLVGVKKRLLNLVKPAPDLVTIGQLPFTPRAIKVLEWATAEARTQSSATVEPVHILLGLILEQEGLAAQVLGEFRVNPDAIRRGIAQPHKRKYATDDPRENGIIEEAKAEVLESLPVKILFAYGISIDQLLKDSGWGKGPRASL